MNILRRNIRIRGVVQGVGFRPFVWRLARELDCTGSVCNDARGVTIEIQGPATSIESFLNRLTNDAPVGAQIQDLVITPCSPQTAECEFSIQNSGWSSQPIALVAPDIAPCSACLAELSHPADRRFGYPFINCTNCGPRFTIIRSLPYDRQRTTMDCFKLCHDCQAEYDSPADRRFHAEPNACPVCGPSIWFLDRTSSFSGARQSPSPTERVIETVRERIGAGQIIAIKGIGGFHLACDARQIQAVSQLRERKHRPDKPLAVMVADLETCRSIAEVSDDEARLLTSRERPIVLLRKKRETAWVESIAPGNPSLGIMLPYSPLHILLLRRHQIWVMTSGNLSDEPIAFENGEAWSRLAGIADGFLFHDRPITIPCDDSVVMWTDAGLLPIRRSRGYAPLPISLANQNSTDDASVAAGHEDDVVLAVGGEIKSTVCLTVASEAFVSPHIGDLTNVESLRMLDRMANYLASLYGVRPRAIASDLHPGYLSVHWAERLARQSSIPHIRIQHHHAHAASLIAEYGLPADQPIIAIVFDGTGFGTDQSIWGGEWLLADCREFQRYAHLFPVPLPGGDACILHPARSALAHLFRYGIAWDPGFACVQALRDSQRRMLAQQLERGFQCVETSSMGRFLDAVASLVGIRHQIHYEGQAAIELEALSSRELMSAREAIVPYSYSWQRDRTWQLNCQAVFHEVIADIQSERLPGYIGLRIHETVAQASLEISLKAREETGINIVGLTGGVFQNGLLTGLLRTRLEKNGFEVLSHRSVPPNDAGIALGQAVVARQILKRRSSNSMATLPPD